MLSPEIVELIEVLEFSSEMAERAELFDGDEFSIKRLVIPFDLTATTWVIWQVKDLVCYLV